MLQPSPQQSEAMLLGELIDLLVEVPRDIPFEEFRVLLGHVSNFPRFEVPLILFMRRRRFRRRKRRNFSSLCWSFSSLISCVSSSGQCRFARAFWLRCSLDVMYCCQLSSRVWTAAGGCFRQHHHQASPLSPY